MRDLISFAHTSVDHSRQALGSGCQQQSPWYRRGPKVRQLCTRVEKIIRIFIIDNNIIRFVLTFTRYGKKMFENMNLRVFLLSDTHARDTGKKTAERLQE